MNKPSSELIALQVERAELMAKNEAATYWGAAVGARHERIKEIDGLLAANQSGSERAGSMAGWTDNKLAAWTRNWHWQDTADDKPVDPSIYFRDMRMLKAFVTALATPPAQPAPAATHGKPDGAVREAVCCSAISPCEYQRTHRTGVCETCQKAAAIDRLDVKAETSPGDAEAQPSDHAPSNLLFYGLADAIGLSAKLRFNAGGTIKHEFDRNDIKQLRDVLRPKSEAKSQEPDAVWLDARKLINERLDDLSAANALYGKDNRLNAPEKIERNNREITWLKDLRSVLVLTHPTTKPEAPAVGVDAETIEAAARIIDPDAFKKYLYDAMLTSRRDRALTKATAIAALIAGER